MNLKMAIEIVDLPIKNGDFPWLCWFTRGDIYIYIHIGMYTVCMSMYVCIIIIIIPVISYDDCYCCHCNAYISACMNLDTCG